MLITNFASGELTKKLYGRTDIQQYYQGASKLSNFEIVPTGGIQRRSGIEKLSTTVLSGEAVLIPFIIDKNTNIILECHENICKVWLNGSPYYQSVNVQYTLTLPYASIAELREVQYAQNYNKLILVHKNYAPIEITYNIAAAALSVETMSFNFLPQINLDDDYDFVNIVKSVATTTINKSTKTISYVDPETLVSISKPYVDIDSIYIVCEGNIFKWNDTANAFKDYDSDPDVDATLFTTAGKYPRTVTFFNNRLFFGGTLNKPQAVYASATPDTAGTRYRDFADYQKYVTVNKVTKNSDLHIFTCDIKTENISDTQTVLTNVTQDLTSGLTNDATDYYVSGTLIPVGTKVIAITATTITIDQKLLLEEDADSQTLTIQLWVNATTASAEDYEYQVTTRNVTTSDCSFYFEIASEENDAIKFLASNKYLTIGTESSIWCVPSTITALNIAAENQGRYGSDNIQALCIDQAVCFFAPGKYGIREFYYNNSTEAFQTNNIAILAEQMLQESPAKDFDYVNNPYNKIVIVRADGIAVQMLYDKNNGISAWNRIEHGKGQIKSCAVTHGDQEQDYVYFVVQEGSGYYMERYGAVTDIYLDGFTQYSAAIADSYTDDAILYNYTTRQFCKKSEIPEDFIASGDLVYIGYEFISDIVSMPIIANDPTGKKRITDLQVRFMDSYMPVMKCADQPDEVFVAEELPYSGIQKITYPGKYERDVTFEITASEPYPVNILAISATLAKE